jgi:dTDP-4-dehydrorhamnose reductase
VTQTLALIERLIERGIYVLFLSTNQVFDGSRPDLPAGTPHSPVSEYGRQKAHVEAALFRHMDLGASVGILRMAKVVSPEMSLIKGWVEALSVGRPVCAFNDMTMAPIPIELVTNSIAALMQDGATNIFQLTGPRDVTYAEVALFLAGRLNANPRLVMATSARASSLPKGATPLRTTLDSHLLRERYGISVPDVWDVIDTLVTTNPQSGDLLSANARLMRRDVDEHATGIAAAD